MTNPLSIESGEYTEFRKQIADDKWFAVTIPNKTTTEEILKILELMDEFKGFLTSYVKKISN